MYHRIVLIGHLGAAPDLRYTPSGHAIAHFHLATSDRWTGMDGAVQDRALWWRVSVFGPLAEACHQHLKKGSRVFVEGRLTGDPDTGGPHLFSRADTSVGAAFEVNVSHRDSVRFLSPRHDSKPTAEIPPDDQPL
jgi:single-strand DNA-binding protein